MIIAHHCNVPEVLETPGRELDSTEIENRTYVGDLQADSWVWTKQAVPHIDPIYWKGKLFVTLSCTDGYMIGDAISCKSRDPLFFNKGCIAIIDPMVTHWLFKDSYMSSEYWTGIQWEVKKSDLRKTVHEIVMKLGGRLENLYRDRRYSSILSFDK